MKSLLTSTDPVYISNSIDLSAQKAVYNVEVFHIYTDERIGPVHKASLRYLNEAKKAWKFDYELAVLIDNYNPVRNTLKVEDVLRYLDKEGASPAYWAYEADLVPVAQVLLNKVTSKKLRDGYLHYIEKKGKYPCSLLTAAWYLIRLGLLDGESIVKPINGRGFAPAGRILSILPLDYKDVEYRAQNLIAHSEFANAVHSMQVLFYPTSSDHKIDLW